MAIDTRPDRHSMLSFGDTEPSLLPNPDGTIDEEDRYHLLALYGGVAPAGGAGIPVPLAFDHLAMGHH